MKKKYDIIWYNELDSTNDEAKRGFGSFDNMTVIAARSQTNGKGQRGNSWSAAPGENLTFSIVLKFGGGNLPDLDAADQFAISETAALSVVEFLGETGIETSIKWPNDIYAGDRKICGILIENTVSGHEITGSIVGIGINLNQYSFPSGLPNPTSVYLESGTQYYIEEALTDFMDIFERYVRFDGGRQNLNKLRELYTGLMYRKDEMHSFADCRTGEEFAGIIRGITDRAFLEVEIPGSGIREYAFKEISYII